MTTKAEKRHLDRVAALPCCLCGIEARVTEPRDFGHLKPGWREQYEQEASNAQDQADGALAPVAPGSQS